MADEPSTIHLSRGKVITVATLAGIAAGVAVGMATGSWGLGIIAAIVLAIGLRVALIRGKG